MSSIHLQLLCGFAVLSILSTTVSSQYGSGKPPSPTYGAPGVPQGGSGGYGGAPPPGGQEGSEPEPFNFNYQVKDAVTGSDFGHKADSDGKTVQGSYNVALPDGRKQIVTYTADEGGYKADVKYEGEAIPGPSGPAPGQPGRGGAPGGGARPGAGGGYPAPPSGGFTPPPPPGQQPGGSKGNFPAGYPSGGGGGPVKGSGGFGGYRRK
ncbi:hypothetical protein M8J76_007661 [Diaphorina citri]|nr:hypothetical protein M8J76_007661 [Diaphorina citri]